MRMLHLFDDARAAETLSDALYADGVETTVRPTRDDQYALWVVDETQMDAAKAMLARFQASPADPIFEERQRAARARRKAEEAKEKKSRHRVEKMRDQLAQADATPTVTYGLMVFTVGLFMLDLARPEIGRALGAHAFGFDVGARIVDLATHRPWAFFSSLFVHSGVLHIAFNVMWIRDLGTALERAHSSMWLLVATLTFGVMGVLAELAWTGAAAIGLSGVVYGLLGYMFVRGRLDAGFPLQPSRTTMIWMMGWFAICFLLPGVANGAHAGGLASGALWGYLASGHLGRRLRK